MTSWNKLYKPILLTWLILVCISPASLLAATDLPVSTAPFAPFKYKVPKVNIIAGSDTEIVVNVLQTMGYNPKIEMLPFLRADKHTRKGVYAAYYTFTMSEERSRFYYFSDPVSTVQDVFFKRKGDDIVWENLKDLKPYKIGVCKGYSYPSVFKQAVAVKTLTTSPMVSEKCELLNFRMLRTKRVDLHICEVSVGQHLKSNQSPAFEGIDFINRPVGGTRTFHMGISKKWPGAKRLTDDFNKELAKFVKEGKRKPIFEKYGIVTNLK